MLQALEYAIWTATALVLVAALLVGMLTWWEHLDYLDSNDMKSTRRP
jgi:hypothetical protein